MKKLIFVISLFLILPIKLQTFAAENGKNNSKTANPPASASTAPQPTPEPSQEVQPTPQPTSQPNPQPTSTPSSNTSDNSNPPQQPTSEPLQPVVIIFPQSTTTTTSDSSDNTDTTKTPEQSIIVPLHQPEPSIPTPEKTVTPHQHVATPAARIIPPLFTLFKPPSVNYYKSDALPADMTKFLVTISLALLGSGILLTLIPSKQTFLSRKEIALEKDSLYYM